MKCSLQSYPVKHHSCWTERIERIFILILLLSDFYNFLFLFFHPSIYNSGFAGFLELLLGIISSSFTFFNDSVFFLVFFVSSCLFFETLFWDPTESVWTLRKLFTSTSWNLEIALNKDKCSGIFNKILLNQEFIFIICFWFIWRFYN